jgi:hypothetical protein
MSDQEIYKQQFVNSMIRTGYSQEMAVQIFEQMFGQPKGEGK